MYNFTIKQPWFDLIKNGNKKVEERLNKGIFSRFNFADILIWQHKNLKIKTYVNYIRTYPSFYIMMEKAMLVT
jgi:ASC-1-like (ASCH) protein